VQVLNVQAQEFNWATAVSGYDYEFGVKTIKDAQGNTYIFGYTTSNPFEYNGVTYDTNGDGDVFFAKFDTDKELVWMKSIGGDDPIYYDEALDIHIDPLGDIYLSIRSSGNNFTYDGQILSGINSPGQYSGEAVLLKVNSNGDYIWHDSGTVSSSFQAITTDANGNLYITGYFNSTITLGGTVTLTNPSTGTTKDLLVAKYEPDGTIVWAKHAGGMPHNTFAYGWDIEINPQSNELIVLGSGDGDVYFDGVPMPVNSNSDQAALLISYNLDGTQNWVKRVLDEQNYGYSNCGSLAISSSGIMGVGGHTISNPPEGLVGFYNNDSSVISEHTYPTTAELRIHSITFNEYDKAYLSGWCYQGAVLGMSPGTVALTTTTAFIVKMDIFQQVKWIMEFESSPFDNRVDYANGELLYASRFDNDFIYNSGQSVIVNNSGDALFGEVVDNSLGTEEYLAEDITLYPNPTSGFLLIKTDTLQQVEIYNISGILIETTNKKEIDLSQHSKGIYLLKIITNKGVTVKKIVLK
jgi:hypothetical protein